MNVRSILVLIAVALSTSAVGAQATDPDALIARFQKLGVRQKTVIVANLRRQVRGLTLPAVQRVLELELEIGEIPDADQIPTFDPATWAEGEHEAGRAPKRKPVEDQQWQAARDRFPLPTFVPKLMPEVRFDWVTGSIVAAPPRDWDAEFANYARGYLPATDHAMASIMATFDKILNEQGTKKPTLRELGWWFGHTYCDLNARSYPGITLYHAWYSGEVVDVPDVDAIPFAHRLLRQMHHRSPLSGKPRARLYQDIREQAIRYRLHRTLCEAAAAAYCLAEPELDGTYGRLVPRFHYLFATNDDDVEAVAKLVATRGRDALIATIDAAVKESNGTAFTQREARKSELSEASARVTALAAAILQRFDRR